MKKKIVITLVILLLFLVGSWFLTFPVSCHSADGTVTRNYHFLTGLTLSPPESVPEGYHFDGWFYDADYSTPVKQFDHHLGTVVVYAKYVPNTYSISYSYGTGTEMTLEPSEYTYGTTTDLPDLEKKGYVLKGWRTQDGKLIQKIESTTKGDLSLVPEYEIGKYMISYELSGGIINADLPELYTYGKFPIIRDKPSRTGYAFKYWTIKETGEILENAKDPAGNITLVANWEGIYDSTREGTRGKIQLGKYTALLYDGSDQSRFDNENSAIVFSMGTKTVITDAYAQGFKVLTVRDEDLLWTINGVTTRYKQTAKYKAYAKDNTIVIDDRRNITDIDAGDVCAYVVNTDGTLTVTFYRAAE